MKYSVQSPDMISRSAFIYFLQSPHLFGCYFSISTNHDKELEAKDKGYSFSFEDLKFRVRSKLFILTENNRFLNSTTVEQKLEQIKKERMALKWNCIELDDINELNPAIEAHFEDYRNGVYERVELGRNSN